MQPGWPVSIVLNSAILCWALLSFAAAPPPMDVAASDPIDVELLPPTDVSQQKQGSKTAKPADEITKDTKASSKESDGKRAGDTKTEEPPPPPPAQKPTPPQEKPQQTAATPPPPEPPKPAEPKLEPPKPVAKVEPPPTPPPPKPDLPKEGDKAKEIGEGKPPEVKEPPKDEKALEKLLADAKKPDKPVEKKPDPPKAVEKPTPKADPVRVASATPASAKPSPTPSNLRGQVSDIKNLVETGTSASRLQKQASLGQETGPVTTLKLSQSQLEGLIGALKSQIIPCWNPPPGASESGVKVTLNIALNEDGTLRAEEVYLVTPVSHPLANSIASSAMRAVKMCASQHPFQMPADKYAAWAVNHITFDPKFQ